MIVVAKLVTSLLMFTLFVETLLLLGRVAHWLLS